MKNMRIVILIAITITVLVVLLIFSLKSRGEKKIHNIWNALLESTTVQAEKRNIEKLNRLMASKQGSLEVIGNTKDNHQENMLRYSGTLHHMESIDVTFYWGTKKITKTGWKPLDNNNLYLFFQE